jgi:hypothetical protein
VVFEVPSLTSYTLDRRTQRLRALARTLQHNLRAAQGLVSVDNAMYNDLLTRVESQLTQAQRDVVVRGHKPIGFSSRTDMWILIFLRRSLCGRP